SETVELDLGTVVPSLAGPRRPQDRVALSDARRGFRAALADMAPEPQTRPDTPVDRKIDEDGPDEASAESFPASDPPAAMGGTAPHEKHAPPPPRPQDPRGRAGRALGRVVSGQRPAGGHGRHRAAREPRPAPGRLVRARPGRGQRPGPESGARHPRR